MTTTQEIIKTDSSKAKTYTLLVVFTVDGNAHHNLRHQQAIRDEAASWLQSLDAKVEGVCVRHGD